MKQDEFNELKPSDYAGSTWQKPGKSATQLISPFFRKQDSTRKGFVHQVEVRKQGLIPIANAHSKKVGMAKTLFIAEKPSVGRAIAKALGGGKNEDGYIEGTDYIFSWCRGHLVQLADCEAYGAQYSKWDISDLPLVPEKWQYVLRKDTRQQFEVLQKLMARSDVDTVVNACDAGREGELIFRLVYATAKCRKPLMRMWLSSMEDSAIRQAAMNLIPGEEFDSLFHAAMCRQRADWAVGINATRLFTKKYDRLIRVGRVVSPTLSIVTERQHQIDSFVPQPYWKVQLTIEGAKASSARLDSEDYAKRLAKFCESGTAQVVDIVSKERRQNPPRLFDLTSLQQEANKLFGLTASKTLDIAQTLYEKKLITYPRTDSCFLTDDMAGSTQRLIDQVLSTWTYLEGGRSDVRKLLNSSKVTDHYAIIPTANAASTDLGALSADERRILELIAGRLVMAAGIPRTYVDTIVTLQCSKDGSAAEDLFRMRGTVTTDPGWKANEEMLFKALRVKTEKEPAAQDKDEEQEESQGELPNLRKGDVFRNPPADVVKSMTKPPAQYTEASLLSAMEKAGTSELTEETERKGLGTPATRAQIIEKLVGDGMIVRKGRKLTPTKEAAAIISLLPEELASASMTADWENRLARIADGRENPRSFMSDIESYVGRIVSENKAPAAPEVQQNLMRTREADRKVIGKCPRCGNDVAENKAGWGCTNPSCKFMMFRNDKFFSWKKKKFTDRIARELLRNGRAFVKGMYSEKKNAKYDAFVVLNDTGTGYVKYSVELKRT